jgi:hypothetical protein
MITPAWPLALALCTLAAPVLAQSDAQSDQTADRKSSAREASALDEIVITAEKRE